MTSVQPRSPRPRTRRRRGPGRRRRRPTGRSPGSPRSTIGPATACGLGRRWRRRARRAAPRSALAARPCRAHASRYFCTSVATSPGVASGPMRNASPMRAARSMAGADAAPIHTSSGSGGTGAMCAVDLPRAVGRRHRLAAAQRAHDVERGFEPVRALAQRRVEDAELLVAAADRALHDERARARSTRACRSARRAAPDARAATGTARRRAGRPTRRAGGRGSGRSGSRAPARCGGRRRTGCRARRPPRPAPVRPSTGRPTRTSIGAYPLRSDARSS